MTVLYCTRKAPADLTSNGVGNSLGYYEACKHYFSYVPNASHRVLAVNRVAQTSQTPYEQCSH